MKLKFNINNTNFMKNLYYHNDKNMKNIHRISLARQIRSKLIDLPAIYSSESRVGNLGE
jgi:hypothetical protein